MSELTALAPVGRRIIQRANWLGVKLPEGHYWLPGNQSQKWWALMDSSDRQVVTLRVATWTNWEPRVNINGLPSRNQPGYPGGHAWATYGCYPGGQNEMHPDLHSAVQYAAGLAAWWLGNGAQRPVRSNAPAQAPKGKTWPAMVTALTPGGRQWLKSHQWLGVELPNGYHWQPSVEGIQRWHLVNQRGNKQVTLSAPGWAPMTDEHGMPTNEQPKRPADAEWSATFLGYSGNGPSRDPRHSTLKAAVKYAAKIAMWQCGKAPYPGL